MTPHSLASVSPRHRDSGRPGLSREAPFHTRGPPSSPEHRQVRRAAAAVGALKAGVRPGPIRPNTSTPCLRHAWCVVWRGVW
eukprot:scaffold58878_cov54-Phaeocystis_antarctica.AAC.2